MSFAGMPEALAALIAALETASGSLPADQTFRVVSEPGEPIDPPAAVVLPPSFTWEGPGSHPRTAVWTVAIVVAPSEYLVGRLFDLLPIVTEALDETVDCVMQTAEPDIYRTGSQELPGYFLRVEVAL